MTRVEFERLKHLGAAFMRDGWGNKLDEASRKFNRTKHGEGRRLVDFVDICVAVGMVLDNGLGVHSDDAIDSALAAAVKASENDSD